MNSIQSFTQSEPVLTWATGNLTLNVAQILAIPHMATWLHVVILIVTSFSATLGARNQVTPVSKIQASEDNPVYK